jgi:hypothetical protein
MANDLLVPPDLDDFPGAPFTDAIVDAAVATVRSIAGWHIAPSRPVDPETEVETVTVDGRGGSVLYLPTRYLTDVIEIRDLTGDSPVILIDWRASTTGKLTRYCWPYGLGTIEADIVHGYPVCPPELLPIIAAYCVAAATDSSVSQESVGPFSRTLRDQSVNDGATAVPAALAALSLAWGVA